MKVQYLMNKIKIIIAQLFLVNISSIALMAVLAFLLQYTLLLSQTDQKATSTTTNKDNSNNSPSTQPPLELPTFIIEGVEHLNVKAGIKQFPAPPTELTSKELDSLNPLEKQSALLVPPPNLPKMLSFIAFPEGFLKAQYGLFSTANILAGYGAKWEGYDIYAKGGYNSSQGDVQNSDFNSMKIDLHSDYIAPDFFWIFGGSRTRTKTEINYSDYKLYGTDSAYNRKNYDIDFSLTSDGNYEGVNFSTGLGFYTLQLNQNSSKAFENRVQGFIDVNTLIDNYSIGLLADLNVGNLSGKDLSFYQFSGSGAVYYDKMTLEGELGYQIATNTLNNNESTLALKTTLSYLPNMNYSVRVEFLTGLEKDFYKDFFRQNPYITITNGFMYPKVSAIIRGIVQYLPDTKKGITLTAALNFYEKYPYFNSDSLNNIDLLFETANIIKLKGEGFWEFTSNDKLIGSIGFNIGMLEYQNNVIPYLPPIQTSLNYLRKWSDDFNSEIGFLYNSARYTDKDNKNQINSYLNLFAKANYQILEKLQLFLELDNLTNNNNMLWQGYRERGLFGSFGINWQF
jgi:hypothetical protein